MLDARIRLPALALCVLVSLASRAGAGEVRVTMWEGLPSAWDWNAPNGQPDDRYDTPAMGFSRCRPRSTTAGSRSTGPPRSPSTPRRSFGCRPDRTG